MQKDPHKALKKNNTTTCFDLMHSGDRHATKITEKKQNGKFTENKKSISVFLATFDSENMQFAVHKFKNKKIGKKN